MKKLWYFILIIGTILIGFDLKNLLTSASSIRNTRISISKKSLGEKNQLKEQRKENLRKYLVHSLENQPIKNYP